MQCLEAALGRARPGHAVNAHRFVKALEPVVAQVLDLKQAADQTPGALGDDDLSGRSHALQAGGKVRRLADHGALAGLFGADQVAHHDQPGCDSDARRQSFGRRHWQRLDRRYDREPGVYGALRRVLMRCGPAEVAEHPVAHEFGDVAAEAGNCPGHRILVGPDDVTHLLRVEPCSQRRRADQVGEHHGQLPPLGFGGNGFRRLCSFNRNRSSFGGQASDRFEQLLARTERQAKLLQITLGQLREHRPIDLVVAKDRLVSLQTQLPQPIRDVHGHPRRQS